MNYLVFLVEFVVVVLSGNFVIILVSVAGRESTYLWHAVFQHELVSLSRVNNYSQKETNLRVSCVGSREVAIEE